MNIKSCSGNINVHVKRQKILACLWTGRDYQFLVTLSLNSINIAAKNRSYWAEDAIIGWSSASGYNSLWRRRHTKSFRMSSHREKLTFNYSAYLQISLLFNTKFLSRISTTPMSCHVFTNLRWRIKLIHFLLLHSVQCTWEIFYNVAVVTNWNRKKNVSNFLSKTKSI
jgi:hypothetical protein